VVETADKGVSPALLNEATRGSGGDGAATGGSWGTELDPVGLVSGVGMKHRGVAFAEEERLEFWKEGAGGKEVELHIRFFALVHCDSRSLVSGAAEEGKDGAAVFSRDETGCFSSKAREAGNAEFEEGKRERPNGRKPEAGSHFPGRTPATERMAASILESKARKARRLASSSETQAR
jgi:hypothetical protein